MSWNYRVVRKIIGGDEWYAIHEAYYDSEGRVWAVTQDPVPVGGETLAELIEAHTQMLEAQKQPVLDYDAIPESGAIGP